MYETPDHLAALHELLDASHARAGAHLRSILTDDKRIGAAELCELLTGMNLLALATVTAAGEPRVGAVDGHFHRGHWYFGSAHESVRFRHLRVRPQVSATHTRGEELAVVVHGRAAEIDLAEDEHEGLRRQLGEFYGDDWLEWGVGAAYARIDPTYMAAAWLPMAEQPVKAGG